MADPKAPAPTAPASTGFDLQAALAQLRTMGGSAGTADFLGMPANAIDASAVVQADVAAQEQWRQGKTAPAYANGAQYLPVLQNWTPQEIAAVQTRLINSGLLDTDFRSGVWDQPSQQAFGQVLALANNMGSPWQDALRSYESSAPMVWDSKTNSYVKGTPGTARTRAPVVTRFTSPDDLAVTAQEVATAKLGRTFTPEELQKFIAAYHGTEQTATENSAAASAGGGYTAPASIETAAETFAKQTDPTAYNAEQFLPLVQKMNDLLSGTGFETTRPLEA